MKKFFFATLVMPLVAFAAQANILTTNPSDKNLKDAPDVKIAKDGSVQTGSAVAVPVTLVGAGVRSEKPFLSVSSIYVAELLTNDASKYVRDTSGTKALDSLDQTSTVALRLTFVYGLGVPQGRVVSSFTKAFAKNNVNVADAAIAQFLAAIKAGGSAYNNQTMVMVFQKNQDKTETLYYQDVKGTVTPITGKDLTRSVLSIWLGNTDGDDYLPATREQLIKGN